MVLPGSCLHCEVGCPTKYSQVASAVQVSLTRASRATLPARNAVTQHEAADQDIIVGLRVSQVQVRASTSLRDDVQDSDWYRNQTAIGVFLGNE